MDRRAGEIERPLDPGRAAHPGMRQAEQGEGHAPVSRPRASSADGSRVCFRPRQMPQDCACQLDVPLRAARPSRSTAAAHSRTLPRPALPARADGHRCSRRVSRRAWPNSARKCPAPRRWCTARPGAHLALPAMSAARPRISSCGHVERPRTPGRSARARRTAALTRPGGHGWPRRPRRPCGRRLGRVEHLHMTSRTRAAAVSASCRLAASRAACQSTRPGGQRAAVPAGEGSRARPRPGRSGRPSRRQVVGSHPASQPRMRRS